MLISQSARAKYDYVPTSRQSESFDIADFSSGRRRASEAFAEFLPCVDTSSKSLTNNLFSCKKCEVLLGPEECESIGVNYNEGDPKKRFKALVLDGTAAGIIDNLPKYERNPIKLTVPSSLRKEQKLISSRKLQKVLNQVIKIARANLYTLSKRRSRNQSNTSRLSFVLQKQESSSNKRKNVNFLSKEDLNYLNFLLNGEKCICPSDSVNCVQARGCKAFSNHLKRTVSTSATLEFLRCGLGLEVETTDEEDIDDGEDDTENQAHDDYDYENYNDDDDDDDDIDDDIDDDEIQGELQDTDVDDDNHEDVDIDDSVPERSDSEEQNLVVRRQSRTTSEDKQWVVSISVPHPRKCSLLIESFLSLVLFMLTHSVSLMYCRPCDTPTIRNNEESVKDLIFKANGFINDEIPILALDSICAHDKVAKALENAGNCHHGTTYGSAICQECKGSLSSLTENVRHCNPMLSSFIDQLLFNCDVIPSVTSNLALTCGKALAEHIIRAQNYFDKVQDKMSSECKDYWKSYASSSVQEMRQTSVHIESDNDNSNNIQEQMEFISTENLNESTTESARARNYQCTNDEEDESEKTGMSFPGRKQYRPMMTFDQKESKQCGKRYPKSRNHSAGVLTVQCSCSNPKLIGYIVMTRAESTSLALSAVLMFLQILPEYIFYDNACNMMASAVLRIPWLMLLCYVLVDRFHYKSHTCSRLFDPDQYQALHKIKTSSTESIAARIKRSLYHMRYLKGEALVVFLNVRFALLNLVSNYFETYKNKDIEDANLELFFQSVVDCDCQACRLANSFDEQNSDAEPVDLDNDDQDVEDGEEVQS